MKLLPGWLRIWKAPPAATDLRFIRPGRIRPVDYATTEGGPASCQSCGCSHFTLERRKGGRAPLGKCVRCGALSDVMLSGDVP